jgi:hypothetical protein
MSEKKYTASQWAAIEGGHTMYETSKKLTFMQTLGEAKMFRSREQISREGARQLTDHLFVSLMSLYAMSKDYNYAPIAQKYAQQTTMRGGFNSPAPGGTDVYQTMYSLKHPELFKGNEKDVSLLGKVRVDDKKIKRFLDQMRSGNVNKGQAQAFFFKLERDLAIQDPKLRAARRLTQDWDTLTTQQQQLVGSQLMKYFRTSARRSDLFPTYSKFAKDNSLDISKEKKSSIKRAVVGGAAAFAAGYAAGKSIDL